MDSTIRTALVAALLARGVPPSVADQIRVVEDDSNAVRDLTPDKARSLLAMFSDQIRKYGSPMLRAPTPRVTLAQRPFWERYRFKHHNGAQEMARRKRQIDRVRGTWHLAPRPDLLIVQSDGTRLHLNSHGEVCPFYS
jgi:hypothetical protein